MGKKITHHIIADGKKHQEMMKPNPTCWAISIFLMLMASVTLLPEPGRGSWPPSRMEWGRD